MRGAAGLLVALFVAACGAGKVLDVTLGDVYYVHLPDGGVVQVDGGRPDAGAPDGGNNPQGGAPALSAVEHTPFGDAIGFLFGAQGVDGGVFDAERVGVIRGKVHVRDGAPLADGAVRAPTHPEWGRSRTAADGTFSLVVNGGGDVVVEVEVEGYLTVQRRVRVPWNDYAIAEDVALTPLDAKVTAAEFGPGTTAMQVLQGSPSADDAGLRTASVLVPSGTSATVVLPDGGSLALTRGAFRATEYTVGQQGPIAMPGDLPPNVAYTYAVELGLDEARAVRGQSVVFDRPVALYVDNYLNLSVGTVVPTGYYDTTLAKWVPSDNGRILRVLASRNGLADLDLNGDGRAESDAELTAAGISAEERQRIAATWPQGKSLTRATVTHLTPWDCNFPYAPDEGAQPPENAAPVASDEVTCRSTQTGSVITCETQGLGESVALTGVPFSLEYDSQLVAGRIPTLNIPLMTRTPRRAPTQVIVELSVAGQQHRFERAPTPGASLAFAWDGNDAFGRTVFGKQQVLGRTGYQYGLSYAPPPDFTRRWGEATHTSTGGSAPVTTNRAGMTVTLWQDWRVELPAPIATPARMGGWWPSVVRTYPERARFLPSTILTVAGAGTTYTGNGGPALAAQLSPRGVTVMPDGTLLVSDAVSKSLRRVALDGTITSVAGGGQDTREPASAAQASMSPSAVVSSASAEVYFLDGNRVRKVTSDGLVVTVAGRVGAGFSGDGQPANTGAFNAPSALAVDVDGSLLVADTGNHRVRKIDAAGALTTVLGDGTCGAAQLCRPQGLAVGNGAIFVSDTGNARVLRFSAQGLTVVAGTGVPGFSGDDGPAAAAQLSAPTALAVNGSGQLFIADGLRVRRVSVDGLITTVAGNGTSSTDAAEGQGATTVGLGAVAGLAARAEGLLVADSAAFRVRLVTAQGTLTTVAGGGLGLLGVGGPAVRAVVQAPAALAIAADGSVYTTSGHAVMRRTRDGSWHLVAGSQTSAGFSGDGGPAALALLDTPMGLALGADGVLFIADTGNHRVRRVGVDGVISTVAGSGSAGSAGDEGPATAARLNSPHGLSLDAEGVLYIADTNNHRVRRLALDGRITTLAGTGVSGVSGDGALADVAQLRNPSGVSVAADGSVYIADTGNGRVRRVSRQGLMSTVAQSSGACPAPTAVGGSPCLEAPVGVFASPRGLYITDFSRNQVSVVTPAGALVVVAGSGATGFAGENAPPETAALRQPRAAAVGPDGAVYIADTGNDRVRAVIQRAGAENQDEVSVASTDGSEVYVFQKANQRHLRTVSGLTGVLRWRFDYDGQGRLVGVVDGDARKTQLSYASTAAGTPERITGPDGHVNSLAVDQNGYLARVEKPEGTVRLTHTDTGLLTRLEDEAGGVHTFEYEVGGRLKLDANGVGSLKELVRTQDGDTTTVVVRTGARRATVYRTTADRGSGEAKQVTWPDGTTRTSTAFVSGAAVSTEADGTTQSLVPGADARFGPGAPVVASQVVRLPSGLTRTSGETSTVGWRNGVESDGLEWLARATTVNGLTWESKYVAATRTWELKTPMGRVSRLVVDEKERPVRSEGAGRLPVTFGYDSAGRLVEVAQGTRRSTLRYGADWLPSRAEDGAGHATSYEWDQAQRLAKVTYGDGTASRFTHDGKGRTTLVAPSAGEASAWSFRHDDAVSTYAPPPLAGLGPKQWGYDVDGLLASVVYPDGAQAKLERDAAGRVTGMSWPWGSEMYTYISGTGKLLTAARDGQQLTYAYDGPLVVREAATGLVSGRVEWTYDGFFRPVTVSVNGEAMTYVYDDDGLLMGVGPVTLRREGASGRLTGVDVLKVETSVTTSGYGEVEAIEARYAGGVLYREGVTRDDGGDITGREEAVNGKTQHFSYAYDAARRLTGVKVEGVASEGYGFDGMGNRVTANGAAATYNSQGQVLTKGSTSYEYDGNGNRAQTRIGTVVLRTRYDGAGGLLGAQLSDGTVLEYVVDARGRRVGKKRNGVLEEGYLYDGQLRVVATTDGRGVVSGRYVYASMGSAPDAMVKNGTTYAVVKDERGSVRLVVEAASGKVAQRVDYDAWGVVTADSAPGFQPFGYAGGLYDVDTRLVRFGARDYDATTGTWLSPEPLLQDPGYVPTIAKRGTAVPNYAYALNNPLRYTDETGLDVYLVTCGGAIGHTDVYVDNACYAPESAPTHSVVGGGFYCKGFPSNNSLENLQCVFAAQGEWRQSPPPFTTPASFTDRCNDPSRLQVTHIPLSCEDTAAALSRMQSVATSPPTYSAGVNNCHGVAQDIALGFGKRCLVAQNGPFRDGPMNPLSCPR